MPPNTTVKLLVEEEDELKICPSEAPTEEAAAAKVREEPREIVWMNIVRFSFFHIGALYGLYVLPWAQPYTWLWCAFLYYCTNMGITAGVHRLWAHRSYKAKLPLRILLGIFNTLAFQNDIIEWSRDHRVHHKYSETDADPHNAKRGFFFSHMGWLLVRKHREVKEKGKNIDLSDLFADPVCTVQRKFYLPGVILFCFVIPTVVPWYFWGESAWIAFFSCGMFRYLCFLHWTWCVNSVAHLWGNKPYDKNINPVETISVAFATGGEGYHNYHHVFPYDYSTSEHGWNLNYTTMFIDIMAFLGQVTDRKRMSHAAVLRRKLRTGDGSEGFGVLTPPKKTD